METTDRRHEEEHQQEEEAQLGRGQDSPVFSIRERTAIPTEDHSQEEIPAAAPLNNTEETNHEDGEEENDDGGGSDFEFAFVPAGPGLPPISAADEIFSDGHIRPVYPVFDRGLFHYYQSLAAAQEAGERANPTPPARVPLRDLMLQGEASTSRGEGQTKMRSSMDAAQLTRVGSCSSSDADDLEGVPAETYCLWTPGSVPPSPDNLGRKSRSTGSTGSRRWRLRDLVLGRSHSDGRQKLMFFHPEEGAATAGTKSEIEEGANGKKKDKESKKKSNNKDDGNKNKGNSDQPQNPTAASQRKKKPTATELDLATAHRLFYNNHNSKQTSASGDPADGQGQRQRQRRSSTSLPYRKDLFVGIFPHSRSPGRGLGLGFHQGPHSFYGF